MSDWFADVLAFNLKFGAAVAPLPSMPDPDVAELKVRLVIEESHELTDAIHRSDLPEVADAVADLVYVALGLAQAFGIDMRPVWQAVHASNMAKVGGQRRDDGKILKPADWQPPRIEGVLARQTPLLASSTQ